MKSKIFGLVTLSILVLVFAMGAVSSVALTDINLVSSPSNVSNDESSFDIMFTLTNGGVAGDLYYNLSNFTSSQSGLEFSFNDYSIANGATETITATISFDASQTGTITGNINVGNTDDAVDETLAFSVLLIESAEPEFNFCEYDNLGVENQGELNIRKIEVEVTKGFGDDEEWVPLDEIEIEVKIENKGDWDIEDISLEWGLYDEGAEEWVIDLDEEDEFNLDEDEGETVIIKFTLNEKILEIDFDELNRDYVLVVRATGLIDDSKSDYDKDETCAFGSQDIKVILEGDFIVLDNIQLEGVVDGTVECGTTVHVTADLWNIGDSDQEDITLRVYNEDLGIDETLEIGDLDAFDDGTISFEFTIPEGMEEKWYELEFTVYEDNDIFENDYDDEEAVFNVLIKVQGNCAVAEAILSANLESGGRSGGELVVKATITNPGNELTTYVLFVEGYDSWASLVDIKPSTLILDAGKSAEVLITFNVDRDVSGEQLFNIEVLSEGKTIMTQPVEVPIEKSLVGSKDLLTALIVAISIVLIIIIIVLAVKVARK